MESLLNKLKEEYLDGEKLYLLVTKYNLEKIITNAIELINHKIENNQSNKISKISGLILSEINNEMSKITDVEEKKSIQYLLSDIFQKYISKFNSNELIDVIDNLKETCEFKDYDYRELNYLLNLEKNVVIQERNKKNIYYEWLGKTYEFDEICKDLYSKKIILSIKDFKKLFKPITEHIYVKFNRKHKSEIIVLFTVLKEKKLIKPKGTSGHFTPLVQYAVDNDKLILFEKKINKEHENIKKNAVRYREIRENFIYLIESNLSKKDNG